MILHDQPLRQTVTTVVPPRPWLDRWPWLAYLILILAPFLGHLPSFVTGLSTNPIWTESGSAFGIGPSLIIGADFGDPNVGWTNQALGHLAAEDWLHFTLPWWNPYSGIGLPLAGEMQPAAMFLPFVLLLALQNGMFWLEISLQIFAGVATFCLLRRLGLSRLTALVGGLLYAFSGTFAYVPGETILNVLPFLPVLLHGIEDARDPAHRRRAIVLVALGIGGSLLAGFPETAYIDGLLALLWAIVRLFQTPRPRLYIVALAIGGIAGLLLATPQIVAFIDYTMTTTVFQSHRFGPIAIPVRGFASVVLPYVYGPLGVMHGSLFLQHLAGAMCGYIGTPLVLFAAAGVDSRGDRPLAVLLLIWVVLSIGKTFGFPPIMALVDAVPLMNNVSFWRYSSPTWELATIVLACFAIEDLRAGRMKLAFPLAATFAIIAISIWLAWPWARVWHWSPRHLQAMVTWLSTALGFGLGSLILIVIALATLGGAPRQIAVGALLVANAMLLFALPQLSGHAPNKIDRGGIGYLKTHLKLRRFYTLGPIEPNYSAYFDIPNLNHNYLPVALHWKNYVNDHLFTQVDLDGGHIFFAPFPPMSTPVAVNDISKFVRNYRYLGVRYIVTYTGTTIFPTVTEPGQPGTAIGHALFPGQSLTLHAITPRGLADMPAIDSIGFDQGNYDNTASGIMAVTLCAGGTCAHGEGDLSRSPDNLPFTVSLAPPIALDPGEAFSLTIAHKPGAHKPGAHKPGAHKTGTSADAIWLYPASGASRLTTGTGKTIPGRTIQLVFGKSAAAGQFTKVYTDKLMTIWRLSGAAPFYTTTTGTCTLQNPKLDAVTAICRRRATLIRRELFMPGWHATENGTGVPIMLHHEIVQAIPLHPGRNQIKFRFVPPYAGLAWIGFWLGVLVLLWQGYASWINPKTRPA